jgi:hypothetical protein
VVLSDDPGADTDDLVDTRRVLHVAGLVLPLPEPWEQQEADRPRELRFHRPPIDADRFEAELQIRGTTTSRAGDVEAAIRHWISRMQTAEGDDANRIAVRSRLSTASGITIHFLEIDGVYLRSMGGGPMTGGRAKALPGYRLVGAIVLAPRGTALFEIVGPEATARSMERELRQMLNLMDVLETGSS